MSQMFDLHTVITEVWMFSDPVTNHLLKNVASNKILMTSRDFWITSTPNKCKGR